MSLGEPQYPRKLMWWEYVDAKKIFVAWVFLIGFLIFLVAAGIEIWWSLK